MLVDQHSLRIFFWLKDFCENKEVQTYDISRQNSYKTKLKSVRESGQILMKLNTLLRRHQVDFVSAVSLARGILSRSVARS